MEWRSLAACLLAGCTVSVPEPEVRPPAPPAPPPVEVQPPLCAPTTGGPYWVEEGAEVQVPLRCGTGVPFPGEDAHFVALPPGARYDAATATLRWTPGLDQARVWQLRFIVGREQGTLKIGVADKFDDPDNVPVVDPAAYTEEFGLPVFHLSTTPALDAALKDLRAENSAQQSDSCAPLCIPDPDSPIVVTYRGHVYQATGHYRGASSLGYPKKNYTLKFPKGDRFNEPEHAGGRMTRRHELALISTFDDNSYARWRLSFELWNRMDPEIIRVEHFSAVVYVDGKYHGLYAVSDKIDDEMMERHGLSKDGDLFMGITHNANFDALVKQGTTVRPRRCAYEGFTKKAGSPDWCEGLTFVPEAFDSLGPFIDFVANTTDEEFTDGIERRIVVRDYFDWFIHSTAVNAVDSYEKNALHYHDPASDGPWRVVVWDYNGSFGQSWNTVRLVHTANPAAPAMNGGPPATNRIWYRLWGHPTFGPQLRERYAKALRTVIKKEDVLAAFDAIAAETADAARRDERKWASAYRSYYGPTSGYKRNDLTTYDAEVAYARAWIGDRWEYLLGQFP